MKLIFLVNTISNTTVNNLQNHYLDNKWIFGLSGPCLPDGDICEFLWSNSDALRSLGEVNLFPKPACFPHSYNVFDHLEWIWEAIFVNNMSFILCFIPAFAVSFCMNRNRSKNLNIALKQ